MAELRGVVSGIRWTCPDGTGRVIAELRTSDDKRADILGHDESQVVRAGNNLLVLGDWREDETRGPQFQATAFIRLQPRTQDGTIRYLREVAGLTDGEARKCWRRWGERAVEVLRLEPDVASASGAVGTIQSREIAARLQRDIRYQEARIGLATLFAGRRFPTGVIGECVERWGERAADVVRADPFVLLSLPNHPVGFERADTLYLAAGGSPVRLKRQTLLVCWLIEQNRDGHTWMSATALESALESYDRIGKSRARPFEAFRLGLKVGRLVKYRDADGRTWLSTPAREASEVAVADAVYGLLTALTPL